MYWRTASYGSSMHSDTIILTRRIQLFINSDDKVSIGDMYKTLYRWQQACFRAANYISTHCYVQEQLKDMFYLTEGIQLKLKDVRKDPDGIFTTSHLNTTYQVLIQHFKGSIPMHILSSLNMALHTHFNNEKAAYIKGERAVRNYKKDIPIPFRSTDIKKWQSTPDGRNFTFNLFSIPFRTYLGRDTQDKKVLIEKILKGEVQLCSSAIQLKKEKIFLLAVVRMPKEQHVLDDSIIAEAALSIEYPVTVSIGRYRYNIGNKEEYLYRRLAIQAARQRIQKAIMYNRCGKGRKKKMQALERFEGAEKNYIHSRLHVYSRRLIDVCIKHNAATLILSGQQDKEAIAKEDEFLLRNWSYYALKEKVCYKAEKAGITVITE